MNRNAVDGIPRSRSTMVLIAFTEAPLFYYKGFTLQNQIIPDQHRSTIIKMVDPDFEGYGDL